MSHNSADWARYQTLREEFFAANADTVVSSELEKLILDDDRKKRDFIEHLQFRAVLSIAADRVDKLSLNSAMLASESTSHTLVRRRKTPHGIVGLGALAAAIWFLIMAIGVMPRATRTTAVIAFVTYAENSRFREPLRAPVVGSQLAAGRLELVSGVVRLKLAHVEMTLEGPVELELVDESYCRLLAGRIFVSAKENTGGLTLELPHAVIFDRGGEFGINVADDSVAELFVMAGRVEVRHRGISETIDANDTDNYRFFVDGPEQPETRSPDLTGIAPNGWTETAICPI